MRASKDNDTVLTVMTLVTVLAVAVTGSFVLFGQHRAGTEHVWDGLRVRAEINAAELRSWIRDHEVSLGAETGIMADHARELVYRVGEGDEASDAEGRIWLERVRARQLAVDAYVADSSGRAVLSAARGGVSEIATLGPGLRPGAVESDRKLLLLLASPVVPPGGGVARRWLVVRVDTARAAETLHWADADDRPGEILLVIPDQPSDWIVESAASGRGFDTAKGDVAAVATAAPGEDFLGLDREQEWVAAVVADVPGAGWRVVASQASTTAFADRNMLSAAIVLSTALSVTLVAAAGRFTARSAVASRELKKAVEELTVTNRKLAAAGRAKTTFLANVSHELRTPLNSIVGFSGLLGRGLAGELNEEQARQVAMIDVAGRHLHQLIDDILDLVKVEAGESVLELESVDLPGLVREVGEMMAPLAEERGLVLRVDVPDAMPELVTDRRKVRQVLLNLAGNAVKFTDVGDVVIGAEDSPDGGVRLWVRDTGPGIAEGCLEAVFAAFVQCREHNGDAAKTRGTGLGLSLSKGLAEVLGGTLTVQSKVGTGSTFTLGLPRHPPAPLGDMSDLEPPPGAGDSRG